VTRRILSVVAAILVCSASLSAQSQKEISLISWTLFRPALDKLIPRFESKTGYKVNLTWAPGPDSKDRVAAGDI
jgi:ABC-type glycerol-3-phosphate transport system substrate-binding protein